MPFLEDQFGGRGDSDLRDGLSDPKVWNQVESLIRSNLPAK
jgi:hypothetical protein